MISANLSAIFYLVSVKYLFCFKRIVFAETSRQGNFFGIIGMVIAITVTFLSIENFSTGFIFVLIFILVGGSMELL